MPLMASSYLPEFVESKCLCYSRIQASLWIDLDGLVVCFDGLIVLAQVNENNAFVVSRLRQIADLAQ